MDCASKDEELHMFFCQDSIFFLEMVSLTFMHFTVTLEYSVKIRTSEYKKYVLGK